LNEEVNEANLLAFVDNFK